MHKRFWVALSAFLAVAIVLCLALGWLGAAIAAVVAALALGLFAWVGAAAMAAQRAAQPLGGQPRR